MTSRAALCLLLTVAGCRAEPLAPIVAEAPPPLVSSEPTVTPPAAGAAAKPARPLGHLAGVASEVTSVEGDIVAKDAAGQEARLTATGMDLWPQLAPDGRTIVFSRGRSTSDGWPRDLYLARVDGGEPELLVAENPDVALGNIELPLYEITRPEVSLDGRRVFFQIQNGFHNPGLCGIDLATRKITLLATQKAHAQIRRGPHRGRLLVLHYVAGYVTPPGSREWDCEIVDAESGRRVGPHDCWSTRSLTGIDDIFGLKL